MVRFLISTLLHLAGNALGLIIAAAILEDMTLDGVAFVIAVLIFTVVEMIAQPLLRKMAMKNVEALQGGVALVSTYVGLLITDIASDGLEIKGLTTWVLATLIVWLGAVLAGVILPAIFLKNKVEQRRG